MACYGDSFTSIAENGDNGQSELTFPLLVCYNEDLLYLEVL
jgi:hypothetical protein